MDELRMDQVLSGLSHKARRELTDLHMKHVIAALDSFNLDNLRYPESLEDLVAMPNYVRPERFQVGGYLHEIPTDGWGRKLLFRRIANGNQRELMSFGADGREGGQGYDADILK